MKPFPGISPLKMIAAVWLFTLLASCSLAAESPDGSGEPLRVEFAKWWGDYTIIIAQQKGFFEKHGVQVEPVFYPVFSRALPDLAAGQLDGGLFAIGDAINVSQYTELTITAVYDNGGHNTVVAVPEIKSIRDLAGKRVGVQVGTSYELLIHEMLASAGMKLSDIVLIDKEPAQVPSSLGKTIDAGFIYEPYTSVAIARGNTLLTKSTEFSGLYPDVIVFRSAVVKERSQSIRAFLKAWFEAVEYRRQNPEEARIIIAEYLGQPVDEITPDEELKILDLQANYDIFQNEPTQKRSIYHVTRLHADFLIRIGVLPAQPDLETLLSPNYLP